MTLAAEKNASVKARLKVPATPSRVIANAFYESHDFLIHTAIDWWN